MSQNKLYIIPVERFEDLNRVFESLKGALKAEPVLSYSDYENPFLAAKGSSINAFGALLLRLDADGRANTFQYASRALVNA